MYLSNPNYVVGNPHEQVIANKQEIMHLFTGIMHLAGINPDTPDTKRTPERFWETLVYATKGYPQEVTLERTYEDSAGEEFPVMRISQGIPFVSFCEHHWMPFVGTVDIAYIPKGRVTGMSKLPQVVQKYAHRFQNQERMTEQIAEEIWEIVEPMGVYVISKGRHMCELIEGFSREGPYICSAIRGKFTIDVNPRTEVLSLLNSTNLNSI